MNEKIIIGKHTLESLTSGMYSDPYLMQWSNSIKLQRWLMMQ